MTPNKVVSQMSKDVPCGTLSYDIPDTVKMPNPSGLLESMGMFRSQYSVWVGTLATIAMLPLEQWAQKGVVVDVMEYKDSQWEKVRAQAERALNARLDEFRQFMDAQIAKAEATFAQAETEQSAKLTQKARWQLRVALNDGLRRVKAAQATLLMFDLLNTREDLLKAFQATSDAYMAAHETRAWLRKRKDEEPLEQEAIDFKAVVIAEPEPEPQPEQDPFAALDFLSGVGQKKVKL